MKILKRNYGNRNLILFLIFSLVYLHAVYCLSIRRSLFSIVSIKSFFIEHYLVLALSLVTSYMVLNLKKYSEILLLICLTVIVGKNFILLSGSFNKLALVFNFAFLVFAFYFFTAWELEVKLASFIPKFSKYDLEKESRFKLKANIYVNEDWDKGVNALITNIDKDSCFLLIENMSKFELSPTKVYFLESIYEDVRFRQSARLVSSYDRGFGFAFEKSLNNRLSWPELYKVCLERGIVV